MTQLLFLVISLQLILLVWLMHRYKITSTGNNSNATDRHFNTHELVQLAGILDLVRQGFLVVDLSGVVRVFNTTAETIFGYSSAEVLHKSVATLVPAGDENALHEDLSELSKAQAFSDREIVRQLTGHRKSGEFFPLEVVLRQIWLNDENCFIAIIKDNSKFQFIVDQLHAAQRQIQTIIDSVPHMIFAQDVQGRFVLANQAVAAAYGTSVEELLQSQQQLFHPSAAELESMMSESRRVLETGEPSFVPLEKFTSGQGQCRFLQTYRVPLKLGQEEQGDVATVLTVAVDISENRNTEDELRVNNRRLQALVQNAPIAIAAYQYEQGISVSNKKFQQLIGYSKEELAQLTLEDITHADDCQESQRLAALAVNGAQPHYSYQTRYVTKQAESVQVEAFHTLVRGEPGSPDIFVVQVLDLTEKLARENELQETRERLSYASGLAFLGQMTAGIANELNQPLAAISTYAEIGRRYLSQAKFELLDELFDKLSNQALRAGAVTETMQHLVRHHDLDFELEDCNQIMGEACKLAKSDGHLGAGQIRVSKADCLPLVRCDGIQIVHAIVTLIREILDAGRTGRFKEPAVIELISAYNAGAVEITVAQFASNLDAVQTESVSEIVRPELELNMRLSICLYIINAHGGELRRYRNANAGAWYKLSLPITGDNND